MGALMWLVLLAALISLLCAVPVRARDPFNTSLLGKSTNLHGNSRFVLVYGN